MINGDLKMLHPLELEQRQDLFLGEAAFLNVLLIEGYIYWP